MDAVDRPRAQPPSLRARRAPVPVAVSSERLVRRDHHPASPTLPLVISPAGDAVNLAEWCVVNRPALIEDLNRYGAILFRGFGVDSVAGFEEVVRATGGEPLAYSERSSPRSRVMNNVYTSTDHPPSEEIFLHNEQSYNLRFPSRIYFGCMIAAATGGETPLADCRKVYARLRRETVEKFAAGYLYVRNFNDGVGLTWEEAFQTHDKAAVEDYCARNEIEWEWKPGGRLRTRQRRRASGRHPRTGEMVWCNHLTFFNLRTLSPDVQEALVRECGADVPNDTFYADGTPIEDDTLIELQTAYRQEKTRLPWERGDVLFVDNMLTAHARSAFSGERRIVTALTDPWAWSDIAQA
jgi:alpha-ketoglutarate-dependent taurine dioxygenase